MIETPFNFEPNLLPEEYQKLGQLSLRWSHIEHVIGNCLKVMLRLSEDEAIVIVFPASLELRLRKMKELAEINELNPDAQRAHDEIQLVMKGIQYVRNNVVHAVVIPETDGEHTFHLRSKKRSLTKEQIFSTEELTNYAAHAALSLRYALGHKQLAPGARYPLPDRPEIPKFLRELIPTHKK